MKKNTPLMGKANWSKIQEMAKDVNSSLQGLHATPPVFYIDDAADIPQEVFDSLVPKSAQEPQTFEELVGECIGRASVCWSELPGGVFDSVEAKKLVDKIIEWHEREMRDALKLWINGGR